MTAGPYRESGALLICPRCGEPLERVFDDVLACSRCHGVFITPPTAGLAFDDPAWPRASSAMWWKSTLACPICAHAGATTVMAAQTFEGTQIDRCAEHGLWLDAGELSRITRTTGDELAYLRSRLQGGGDQLDARRTQWRQEVDARRRAAEEQAAQQAAVRARAIEEADRRHREDELAANARAEEQRRIEAAWRAPVRPASTPVEAPPPPPAPPPKPTLVEIRERERAEREAREELDRQRVEIAGAIGELEIQLIEARTTVRELEAKLATERARLRALLSERKPVLLG